MAFIQASTQLGNTPALQSLNAAKFSRPQPLAATRTTAMRQITCMAHPRRVARVAKQIEREVGSLLTYDKVLQKAVCPERRRGLDGAISALASVTEVQISNDLQVAKIYMSIYSDDEGKQMAMAGLQRLEGYVRKHVGRAIRLRLTPEIRFVWDESIERSERVMKLLEQVRAIGAGEIEPPPIFIADDVAEELEDDEEDEEDDGDGIIAVDLDMFGGGEEEDEGASSSGGKARNGEWAANRSPDAKVAAGDLGVDEVEEMMALFRQESARKAAREAGGRQPRRGGGGGGKSGGGGRYNKK